MDGNRRTLRYSVELAATVVIGARSLACEVRDVSLGGAFVHGARLQPGTRVELRFAGERLAGLALPCVARWHDDRGTGVELEEPGAIDDAVIAGMIRASREAGADLVPG